MSFDVSFSNGPIAVPAQNLPSREIGAVVEFHGVVREQEGATMLTALYYEAYEPMARRQFDRIFAELSAMQPVQDVVLIHRLGRVAVGEASLYIRVMAKHRGQALAFCGLLIDRMKEDVAIWKVPQQAGR